MTIFTYLWTVWTVEQLRKSCFGFSLDQNYKECIKKFRDDWIQLNLEFGVTIPNKCHIIFSHLEDFIERHKKPLGGFTEEVVEAAHQRLDKIWDWYCVKMLEKEAHGEKFLMCINHFNSFNI